MIPYSYFVSLLLDNLTSVKSYRYQKPEENQYFWITWCMEEMGRDMLFQWKNFVVKHLKLETNTYYMDIFFSSFQENVCVRTTKHNKVFEYER